VVSEIPTSCKFHENSWQGVTENFVGSPLRERLPSELKPLLHIEVSMSERDVIKASTSGEA